MKCTFSKANRIRGMSRAVAAFCAIWSMVPAAWARETVFFASDIHASTTELKDMLSYCTGDCERVALVGDYGDDINQFNLVVGAVNEVKGSSFPRILSVGNHELGYSPPGVYGTGQVDVGGGNDYEIYVISPTGSGAGTPSLTAARDAFVSWAADHCSSSSVLFVMNHIPLHSIRNSEPSENLQAKVDIFRALQKCSGQGRDIVVLWGHTHHSGEDPYVRTVARMGESIGGADSDLGKIIPDVTTPPLKFSYVNAGFIKPELGDSNATLISVYEGALRISRKSHSFGDVGQWWVPRKSKYLHVVASHSDKCLAVAGTNDVANGANVQQETCSTDEDHQWMMNVVEWASDGNPIVQLKARHSGKCLDVDGAHWWADTNVQQWDCVWGVRQQHWKLEFHPTWAAYQLVSQNEYRPAEDPLQCLDVHNGLTGDPVNVKQWDCVGVQQQAWYFTAVQP